MESMYYIGLDVHKKLISYCVKDASGRIHAQDKIAATRYDLDVWMKTLPGPWMAAMEATMFTGWIYDHLKSRGSRGNVYRSTEAQCLGCPQKKLCTSGPNTKTICSLGGASATNSSRVSRYAGVQTFPTSALQGRSSVRRAQGTIATTVERC
jgi:hypothetical protein